jgi:CubicO group peptidase (beta-lactamase class C family)
MSEQLRWQLMETQALAQYFSDLERLDKYSGVVLITQGQLQLFARAYGYASRSWNIRNNMDIRFDTASITKLFTAVATLQLIDQGLLSFDTRVIDFLGLSDTNISKDVTVYHLLTHTSGIGDDADEEAGERYEDIWEDRPNYSVLRTVDFLPQFIHKPPNFAPGAGCRYCNVSFVLLGLMIEKITSLDYAAYVQQHIFDRAGMSASGFFRKDRVHPNLAEGADPLLDEHEKIIGWKKNIYAFPPIGSPDGGAYVTAHDLDRFLRTVQAGTLLSSNLTSDFLCPKVDYHPRRGWMVRFGYVFEFFVRQSGQVDFYQKGGVNVGVSAVLRHYPAHDTNVVLLSNMEHGVWEPIWKVHEILGG